MHYHRSSPDSRVGPAPLAVRWAFTVRGRGTIPTVTPMDARDSPPGDTQIDAELDLGLPPGGVEAAAMSRRLAHKMFGEASDDDGDARDDQAEGRPAIGRFEVHERIGVGGMGVVYLARDPKLQRDVALKVLHPASMNREVDRARLHREGTALAKLSHPNVVHIYEVGEHQGSVFLAMEHVDGVTLKEWQKGEHAQKDVLAVYLQAGEGLAAAHDVGLVHRDFKPANVLVGRDALGVRSYGRVRVLDFGLAREPGQPGEGGSGSLSPAASSMPSGGLTRTGAVVGTPAYMAPEQVRGDPIDARADQYAFCVALWEALHGERPFGDRVAARGETPPAPRRAVLPRRAQRALERGLSFSPEDRCGTMRELLGELSPASAGRKRLALAFAGGLGLAAAAGAMAMQSAAAGLECDGVADVSAVWSESRRDGLRATLAALPGEWDATATITAVTTGLGAYAEAWSLARADLCREQPTLAAAEHEARRACLDRRRQQLAETVAILEAADADVRIAGPELVAAMAPVDACAQVKAPEAAEDPRIVEWVAAVDRAELLYAAGRVADASRAIEEVLAEVGEDAPRVRAQALLLRAVMVGYGAGEAAKEDDLFAAAAAAQRSGDDELAARAWFQLAELETGKTTGDATAAERALALGEASLSRLGDVPRLRAKQLAARGQVSKIRGEHEQALEHLQASLELVKAETPASPLEVARAMIRLGNAHAVAGKIADAERTYEAAMELLRAALGDDHPELATLHKNLAFQARKRDDRPTMLEHLERAKTIFERTYGPRSNRLATILVRLGEAAMQVGDHDEAIALGRRAAEIQASLPPTDTDSGGGLIVVAMAQMEAKRYADARATWEELLPRLDPETHGPQRAGVLQNLGSLSMRLEDYSGARDWYEKLLRHAEPGSEKSLRARAGLGAAEIRLGEIEAGMARLEALRALDDLQDPAGTYAWHLAWHLAVGYAKKGDRAHARELAVQVRQSDVDPDWKPTAVVEIDGLLGEPRRGGEG
jgi:tetratricopeptide (TPR) repeat protein/tRNA A-37 threonylcarbamoyl transferase component Bud32